MGGCRQTGPRKQLALLGAVLLWGAAAWGPARAARAAEAEIEPSLVLPPKAMEAAPTKDDLREERERTLDVAERKLLQARLMFELKRLQACIDLCDEVLAIHPGNKAARQLKRRAGQLRLQEETDKLDTERRIRDNALLEAATEEGLPEPFGPELPRPDIGEADMPFADTLTDREAQERLLGGVIPEINLIEADLNYVLQLLFKTTGVNIVYKPDDVAGKSVTIHARNLTLEDILKYLSRTLDIGYTVDKGTVWVYGADNADAARALMKPVVIPISIGMTEAGQGQRGAGSEGGGGGGVEEDEGTHIEEVLTWMAENWPGWPDETKWMIDKKLSRLIISSTPDIIQDVREMVAMLDVPTPQVLIVARFVRVEEDDLDQLGFDWNLTPSPNHMPDRDADGNLTDEAWRDNKVRLGQTDANLQVAADAFTTSVASILNDHQLSVAMQALRRKTGSKVLVAPRVIAQNDRWATIDLTDKFIWYQDVEVVFNEVTTDSTSQSSHTVVPTDPKEEEEGFRLDVKPRVGTDMRTITLKVIPRITTRVGNEPKRVVVTTPEGTAEPVEIPVPIMNTQTITVDATVEDNHTLVVGGLFLDTDTHTRRSVPVLDKLPILGNLFRSKNKSRDRSCLLIFVTARLLTPRNSLYDDRVTRAEGRQREHETVQGRGASVEVLNDWLGDPAGR